MGYQRRAVVSAMASAGTHSKRARDPLSIRLPFYFSSGGLLREWPSLPARSRVTPSASGTVALTRLLRRLCCNRSFRSNVIRTSRPQACARLAPAHAGQRNNSTGVSMGVQAGHKANLSKGMARLSEWPRHYISAPGHDKDNLQLKPYRCRRIVAVPSAQPEAPVPPFRRFRCLIS